MFSEGPIGVSKTRNIGIIAHIDAGKTTTTERMLYYSGFTRRIGEVDRGDTVMDYLPEERERGITISSAAITFPWRGHQINLIDTPGHVDFSFEVERSLQVLDGAVAIIDARAGVQAQTKTVWKQADRYGIPRIVFVNKLDKIGADHDRCLKDIERDLGVVPLPLQRPSLSEQDIRIADVLREKVLSWHNDGKEIKEEPTEVQCRQELLETIANYDEAFLEAYLEDQNPPLTSIKTALQEITRKRLAVPVLCGASFKNIGVQPLLDAVIDYLPSPHPTSSNSLSMLAFKCVYDAQKGFLVYVRVYSGTYQAKTMLFNSTLGLQERPTKLLQVYADSFEEVSELGPGSIGVLIGLKHTRTGDTLHSPYTKERPTTQIQLTVPPAVFFCSVEPESASEEPKLAQALDIIQREDPSVRVMHDQETGQTLLAGIGELHLEIVQNRIRRDFRVAADFGRVQIGFRERPSVLAEDRLEYSREVNGTFLAATIKMAIEPVAGGTEVSVEMPGWTLEDIASVKQSLESCLQSSPISRYPIHDAKIHLTVESSKESNGPAAVCHALHILFRSLYPKTSPELLEPMMALTIECPLEHVGAVLTDLHSKRRAQVDLVGSEQQVQVISAQAPLKEMLGYASWLRSATQGHASCTLTPAGFRPATT